MRCPNCKNQLGTAAGRPNYCANCGFKVSRSFRGAEAKPLPEAPAGTLQPSASTPLELTGEAKRVNNLSLSVESGIGGMSPSSSLNNIPYTGPEVHRDEGQKSRAPSLESCPTPVLEPLHPQTRHTLPAEGFLNATFAKKRNSLSKKLNLTFTNADLDKEKPSHSQHVNRSLRGLLSHDGVSQRLQNAKDAPYLNLSNCMLDSIPKSVLKDSVMCEGLKELNLSKNKIVTLPPQIAQFKNLVSLDCMFNRIVDLPLELLELTLLTTLQLAGNPLNPRLKQKHLLGTEQVMIYLREKKEEPKTDVRASRLGGLLKRDGAGTKGSSVAKEPADSSSKPDMKKLDDKIIVDILKLGILESMKPPIDESRQAADIDFSVKTVVQMTHEGKTFTFHDYCGSLFAQLRKQQNMVDESYKFSLQSLAPLGFSGKSGSVLLRSMDNLLVLKTIPSEESKFLRKILPQYYEWLRENPHTLLTRFLGLHKVVLSPIEKLNFIVMKNAFSTNKKIHERYDLKGSTVGRQSEHENIRLSRVILKDLDLSEMNRRIQFGAMRRKFFLEQLEKDAGFLERFEIIDYSLIIGIHHKQANEYVPSNAASHPLIGEIYAADDDREVLEESYFMSIIDMLQPYNFSKQVEHNLKALYLDKNGISVVPPSQYATRFLAFVASFID